MSVAQSNQNDQKIDENKEFFIEFQLVRKVLGNVNFVNSLPNISNKIHIKILRLMFLKTFYCYYSFSYPNLFNSECNNL